jgi:hypothetical protein
LKILSLAYLLCIKSIEWHNLNVMVVLQYLQPSGKALALAVIFLGPDFLQSFYFDEKDPLLFF